MIKVNTLLAAAMADASLKRFTDFLEANNIPPSAQRFMTTTDGEGLGWRAISDFAGFFTDKDYEDGVQTDILDKTDAKDNKTVRGRLRVAWRLARCLSVL